MPQGYFNNSTNSNKLIYYRDLANKSFMWYSCDMADRYRENMKAGKLDPIYLTKKISYDFNSEGYRTKEFSEFKENEFFVAMGCSYTLGEGLAQEDVWPAVVGDMLGIDNMNLGISGGGIDLIMRNTFLYLKSDLPKPKFVSIQLPESARKHNIYQQGEGEFCNINDDYLREDQLEEFQTGFNMTNIAYPGFYVDYITHLWNSVGVPVITWSFSGDFDLSVKYSRYKIWNIPDDMPTEIDSFPGDVARDNSHDGIGNNYATSTIISNILKAFLHKNDLNIQAEETYNEYIKR